MTLLQVSTGILPLFGVTIFLSAWLLFTLEPLFTKMALPMLGGAPAVWSVAMVFFQTLMLAGYGYAHLLTRTLSLRNGAIVHGAVLLLAATCLPITLRLAEAPPTSGDPTWWLVRCLSVSIGLPFFALAAQGPLLQAWFARSGHGKARDPYFLYSASNIGSFAALLAYPFLMEPLIGLKIQSSGVAWMFGVCGVMVIGCGIASLRHSQDVQAIPAETVVAAPARALPMRPLAWIVWSFIPAALLVSVTAHISTDIAAAPLLWVIPLGLYLLSFVVAFRERSLIGERGMRMLAPVGGAMALMSLGLPSGILIIGVSIHVGAFFCIAVACGRAIYETRPDAAKLTAFYAIMSLGGALGGLFAGLLAPLIFSSIIEYPILVLASLMVVPGAWRGLTNISRRDGFIWSVLMLSCLVVGHVVLAQTGFTDAASRIAFGGIGVIMLLKWREPLPVLVGGTILAVQLTLLPPLGESGESFRSFFGVSRIVESRSGEYRALVHGNTMHGAIRIRNADGSPVAGPPMPTTYYHEKGPLASALRGARATFGQLHHIAAVGLGAGAMACHVAPGEAVTFYEIDPVVVRLATDPARFRFLSACAPNARIVVGDARLTLAQQEAQSEFILIDAFSSDAIPVHLLTLESLKLYLSKLAPHGIITIHTSNNHMDFAALIGRLATELGIVAYENRDLAVDTSASDMRMPATAIALVRDAQDAEGLLKDKEGWMRLDVPRNAILWTDDFSSILFPLIAKWRR